LSTRFSPALQRAVARAQLVTRTSPARHSKSPHEQVPPADWQQIFPVHCAASLPMPTEVQEHEPPLDTSQPNLPQLHPFAPSQQRTGAPIDASLHSAMGAGLPPS
jgi:hypothetical protein